jgi:hypothetical protein
MARVTQFSVGLDNRPGTLARLCAALRKERVNIEAISVLDVAEAGWVRMVASPSSAARSALSRAGFPFTTQKVLTIRAENRPGELERIASALARAQVSILYVYGSASGASEPLLVFGVSDVDKAARAIDSPGG